MAPWLWNDSVMSERADMSRHLLGLAILFTSYGEHLWSVRPPSTGQQFSVFDMRQFVSRIGVRHSNSVTTKSQTFTFDSKTHDGSSSTN
ncbi:DUF1613 domain-containing protein [Histoplasma ohiense]|nr:DUF1613 domain-containing protein [Histoplasma ohiense (nom. inval.)]